MNLISAYLEKFRSLQTRADDIKKEIAILVKRNTGLAPDIRDVSISRNTLILRCSSSAYMNEIYLHKESIIADCGRNIKTAHIKEVRLCLR